MFKLLDAALHKVDDTHSTDSSRTLTAQQGVQHAVIGPWPQRDKSLISQAIEMVKSGKIPGKVKRASSVGDLK